MTRVREIFNGYQIHIELELENDFERGIFYDKCGKVFLVQFVNDYRAVSREIDEKGKYV